MRDCPKFTPRQSRGFVVAYLLFAISIVMLLTVWVVKTRDLYGSGQQMADVRDSVLAQANLIRSKIIACTINFPAGNNGLGFRLPYPAPPGSGLVSDLDCPGAPTGAQGLWRGDDTIFMPPPPRGMSAWTFAHDATSIRISITATDLSTPVTAALDNVARRIGQATYSTSTNTLAITIAG
jgi:hypothetical protein